MTQHIEMLQIPITREERHSLRALAKADGEDATKTWVRKIIAQYLAERYPEQFGHLVKRAA